MIEILKSSTINDFSQRYQSSYGWCDLDGKRTLVQIDEVHNTFITVVPMEGGVREIACDTGFKFEFVPTARGWYNTDHIYNCVLITRNPQRQWSRGINRSNTNIMDARFRPIGVSLQVLCMVHWDKWDRKWEGKQAVALSRQFMLHHNGTLYFYNRNVGRIDRNTLYVVELVFQEVKDMVNRSKLPFKVERL